MHAKGFEEVQAIVADKLAVAIWSFITYTRDAYSYIPWTCMDW